MKPLYGTLLGRCQRQLQQRFVDDNCTRVRTVNRTDAIDGVLKLQFVIDDFSTRNHKKSYIYKRVTLNF